MLKVLGRGEKYDRACALLLGGFDGLHLGHRALLEAAFQTGLPVGITTMTGAKEGALFTLSEREYIFAREGIDFVLELPFTEELRDTSAEDFLREIFGNVAAAAVFCGEDFRFGKGALGTPALLKKCAPCPVHVLPLKERGGEKVSASRCKTLALSGDIEALNTLLCGSYFVHGVVEHGREVGRTYGFPTVNLSYSAGKLVPREGVYGGYVETAKGRYPAIINVGARPTFHVAEKKLEAHLVGFSGDLYGETVRVFFTKFLRPIKKFESAEELKEQLKKDIKCV